MEIPVNIFEDPALYIIEGLRKRFSDDDRGFEGIRIAARKVKPEDIQPPYELVVKINGTLSLHNNTMREHGASVLVFADTYANANELAAVVCEYLQSLVAFGKIKYVSIDAAGNEIENPGTQELRQVTASIRVRAKKTTLY